MTQVVVNVILFLIIAPPVVYVWITLLHVIAGGANALGKGIKKVIQ